MANLIKEMGKSLKKAYIKKKVAKRRKARVQASFIKLDVFDLPEKFHQVAPLDWVPGPYQERLKAVKPVKVPRIHTKGRGKRSKPTFH